jgi:transposase-like protein
MTNKFDLNHPAFKNEDAARKHLEASRWPDGPVCPHCGSPDRVERLGGKSMGAGWYHCAECREKFTVRVGTLYERSHIPLHKWLLATHLLTSSKKGMSAHQLHRMLGITYKSAWFMAHRIREAMNDKKPRPMGGPQTPVQADETYYGNTSKRAKGYRKGHSHKAQVVALVEPHTGHVRAFNVKKATALGVRDLLFTNVRRNSILVTDESNLYKYTGKAYADHQKVFHTAGKYVNKEGFTTNNVENFFGVFKKGMVGTYHFCGEQHLQRYLNEFAFRYSNRSGLGIDDNQRMALALKGIEGKRLTYRISDKAANA